jgi:hypothetical protein
MTAFMPGASPPLVNTAYRLFMLETWSIYGLVAPHPLAKDQPKLA